MKKLIRIFRIIKVTIWRFNNDFKHWDADKVKGIAIALVILHASVCRSQGGPQFSDIDGAKHFYAGAAISAGVGLISYKVTKKQGWSMLAGFLAGTAAGIVKEAVYDGMMKRGVCNNLDALKTTMGSCAGTMGLGVAIHYKKSRRIEEEYYQHLNDSLRVRLISDEPLTHK